MAEKKLDVHSGQKIFEHIAETLKNADLSKDYSVTEGQLLEKTKSSIEVYKKLKEQGR